MKETFLQNARALIIDILGEDGLKVCQDLDDLGDAGEKVAGYTEVLHMLTGLQEEVEIQQEDVYAHTPVPVDVFMKDPFYMGKADSVYPVIMEELIKINSGRYVEIVLTGGIGPLSCDTEFLSPTGWIRMDQWDGQEVAEYNPFTAQAELRVPEGYHVKPCKEFWHFKTKYGVDMKLSDHHRVLYRTTKGNLNVLTAKEIAEQHERSVKGFTGKFLTTFTAPKRKGVPLSDPEIRLQVAVQADGTFNKNVGGKRCVIRVKKEHKKARLRSIFAAAGVPYLENEVPSDPGYTRFAFQAPLREKTYQWAWECSWSQLNLIATECVHWDGDGKKAFYTTLKEDADFMSYCFSATGRRAVVLLDDRPDKTPCYSVFANTNTEVTMQGIPKTEMKRVPSEDGKMYCFTTKTGFFVARHKGRVFITGNCGKTYIAIYTTAYQLYLLSCMKNAHKTFNKDPSTEIMIIFQSINSTLAKELDYKRFRDVINGSPYFKQYFPFREDLEARMIFPKRIEVVPVSGQETAAIGQDVIGGVIDELNYMAVVQRSKNAVDGGVYNQAVAVYNSIARRRKTRFMRQGKLPGLLCLVSSKRYPGQFTDMKELEAKTDPTIYVYDKRVWDVKPFDYCGKRFPMFIGDASRKPRILEENDPLIGSEDDLVHYIPVEYKEEFERDPINALRELDGTATLARFPFIQNADAVSRCMGKVVSIFEQESVDFERELLTIDPSRIYRPELPRFVHIDLAISQDSAGVAIATTVDFKKMVRGKNEEGEEEVEILPVVWVDALLQVVPPRGGEIKFFKIREMLYALRKLGMNIKWVTFDSFQSKDSQQILSQRGFITGLQSMDTTPVPYVVTKGAFYDERVLMPTHNKALVELASLEQDPMTGKIDHPPGSSKDVADSLTGAIYGATFRRELWAYHKVPLRSMPPSLISAVNTGKAAIQDH